MDDFRLSLPGNFVAECTEDDQMWMARAIELAEIAASVGEVPVGAVLVRGKKVLAEAHNQTVADADPTSHAELLTIRVASRKQGDWRLLGTTLYVTLEPCAMCAGAIILSRIPRVIYAAADPKAGMVGSLGNLLQEPRLNHQCEVTSGMFSKESAQLLRAFFQNLR